MRRAILHGCLLVLVCVCLNGWVNESRAHEIRPAIAFITFYGDGSYRVEIKLDAEGVLSGFEAQRENTGDSPDAGNYGQFRSLAPELLGAKFQQFAPRFVEGVELTFDGVRNQPEFDSVEVPPVGKLDRPRVTTVTLIGRAPLDWDQFSWRYPEEFGPSFLKFKQEGDDEFQSTWVAPGEEAQTTDGVQNKKQPSRLAVVRQFLEIGFTHILPKGLDHILFVLGLFLLSTRWKPLLTQVTAFTVAHTATLALTVYGIISLSPNIVEPLIALSIVYVAVENILSKKLTVWRPFVVFGFGLLHGMGFAGVLQELGLPRSEFLTALVSFNVGVELGQIAVIGLAFLSVGIWGGTKGWYRSRVVVPGSTAIAGVGLFWAVQRLAPYFLAA